MTNANPSTPAEQLAAAHAEALHWKLILAALVKRFGPMLFQPSEYGLIDPDDLLLLGTTAEEITAGLPPALVLREHIRADGTLTHGLLGTAAVIAAGDVPGEQAIAAARLLHFSWRLATDETPTYPSAAGKGPERSDG